MPNLRLVTSQFIQWLERFKLAVAAGSRLTSLDANRSVEEEFVRLAYQGVLRREPDQNSQDICISLLKAKKISYADVLSFLIKSDEFNKRKHNIAQNNQPEESPQVDASSDLIDVRELISSYDVSEHARRADDYFKGISLNNIMLRKPFMGWESLHLIPHLGVVVSNLDYFPGMTVVDFGCGTGWVSQSLALMGCRPIAVDVSQHALDLGKTYTTNKYPEIAGEITYLHYDGLTIGLPDNSVDRVVCMDSFHHVPNQERVLAEFHRILTPDGRAIFCEPGPLHSRTTDSQNAMRDFGVIENDILIEDIWRMAQALGFKDIKLSAFGLRALQLSLAELDTLKSFEEAAGVLQRTLNEIYGPLHQGNRLFTLIKGETRRDSRWKDGLAGQITARMEDAGDSYRISGVVKNIGSAPWRPADGGVGAVNLGLIKRMPDGEREVDFERIPFLASTLPPGEEHDFATTLAKSRVGPAELYIDLVAEGVTWFNFDHPQQLTPSEFPAGQGS